MSEKQLKELKQDIMSCLTDKNVGFVDTLGNKERFGSLLTFGYLFKMIDGIFEHHKI